MRPISPMLRTMIEQHNSNNSQQLNSSMRQNLTSKSDVVDINKNAKNKKMINIIAFGAGIATTIGAAIYCIVKSRGISANNITFRDGIAYLADGTRYTGKVYEVLEDGEKSIRHYIEGVLKK